MGSVKDPILTGPIAERWIIQPTQVDFGRMPWRVKRTFSVGDLKDRIPDSDIPNKDYVLTMTTAAFFEYLRKKRPDIDNCYINMLDADGNETDVQTLLKRGDLSNVVLMRTANIPASNDPEVVAQYMQDIWSGKLQCAVSNVEWLFRNGFPLGSSTYEKIFKAYGADIGKQEELEELYAETGKFQHTARILDGIRLDVKRQGIDKFPTLKKLLAKYELDEVPNPGFVGSRTVYDESTKFAKAGDLPIEGNETKQLSGLSPEGYQLWRNELFPACVQAQMDFSQPFGIYNYDGKMETVIHRGMPVVTDFACNIDENRPMIVIEINGQFWAIPTNKEVQRAVFRDEGIYLAILNAKRDSVKKHGNQNYWRECFDDIVRERKIDLQGITDYSCELMGIAAAEVGNRVLGKRVFDAPSLEANIDKFLPYASRVDRHLEGYTH